MVQLAPHPGPQHLVAHRADGDADQPLHRVTDPLEQLADLVGLALAEHDLPPRVHPRRRDLDELDVERRDVLPLDLRPLANGHHVPLVRRPLDLGQVLAPHAVARMRDAQGEVAVVGEDHQALGVVVQPTDREHLLADLVAEQVDDGPALLRVVGRRHHRLRLVEQQVALRLLRLQPLAVDLDRVLRGVGRLAELGDAAVDRDAAVADQLLRVPARAHPGPGDDLLEPFRSHACRPHRPLPPPRERGARTGRRARSVPGTPWSSGTGAGCRPPACGPPP